MDRLQSRRRGLLRLSKPTLGNHAQVMRVTDRFDEATGQVYSEMIASIPSSCERNWHAQEILPMGTMKAHRLRPSKGSRSLRDTAIQCVLRNISDVTQEVISHLPNSIVQLLWNELDTRYVYVGFHSMAVCLLSCKNYVDLLNLQMVYVLQHMENILQASVSDSGGNIESSEIP